MKNGIHLLSGNFFNFNAPDLSTYNIEDIARNLSHLCRFTGSLDKFYSVAQHSVYVSLLLPDEHAMAGLMHDASEAFLGDVSSPLKAMLAEYKKIEHRVEASIFKKYGLEFPMHPQIKEADNRVFVSERQQLQPKVPLVTDVEPSHFEIVPWTSSKAEKEFLKRYYELGGVFK